MASTVVTTTMSREQVRLVLRALPAILSGKAKDRHGYFSLFWGTVAHSLFESIHEGYEAKSQGEADELGNSWPDLLPRTKAYGKEDKGALTRNQRKKRNNSAPGLLTPSQHKQWKKIFRIVLETNLSRLGERAAKEKAGKVAWAKIKEAGAETLIEVLGQRQDIAILRDTDRLMNSYKPGRLNKKSYTPRKDQIYTERRGGISIGSKVEYAGDQVKTREVIPQDLGIWLDRAIEKAIEAVNRRIIQNLNR